MVVIWSTVMQWYSVLLLPNCNRFAVKCRVHTRAASKPLGVLSLSLQNCPEAAAPSDAPSSCAPEHNNAEAGGDAATATLSSFGAAVKEAMASLVPACVSLPLTVNMVREAKRLCVYLVSERMKRPGFLSFSSIVWISSEVADAWLESLLQLLMIQSVDLVLFIKGVDQLHRKCSGQASAE